MIVRRCSLPTIVLMAWCLLVGHDVTAANDAERYPSLFTSGPFRDTVLIGIHWTENEQFAQAESLFTILARKHPDSPVGPLFTAAAIHGEMLDSESPARANELRRWLDEAITEAGQWATAMPASGEPEFVLGAAYGYDAVYESHWGGWFAALKRGLSAKGHFARALELDSTIVDAYLGLGTYNYWKAVKTDFINWLPVVPDNRDKGLAQLQRVIADGVLSRNAARASLCYALINEEDYLPALAHADTLASQLPNAKSPLWIMAEASMGLYRWREAVAHYDSIAARIKGDNPGNYYNLIECAAARARALYEAGEYRDALAACHEGLGYPAPDETLRRQKRTLDQLRRLQRQIKDLTQPTR